MASSAQVCSKYKVSGAPGLWPAVRKYVRSIRSVEHRVCGQQCASMFEV